MKDVLYYASAILMGLIIFLFIFDDYTNHILEKSENHLMYGKNQINLKLITLNDDNLKLQGIKEFENSTSAPVDLSKMKKFASWSFPDKESKLHFFIQNDEFKAIIINKDNNHLYTNGTFYASTGDSNEITSYTFNSREMSPLEAYYRFNKFNFGTFYENINRVQWPYANMNKKLYESWRLVEENGKYRDLWSDKLFEKEPENKVK